jgi:hypothetical protein
MAISAVTSKPVEHPEIPYDKVRYDLSITTRIGPDGELQAGANLTLRAARVLPPAAGKTTERWQDDNTRRAKTHVINDLFSYAATVPEVAAAIGALNAAVAAVNAHERLV